MEIYFLSIADKLNLILWVTFVFLLCLVVGSSFIVYEKSSFQVWDKTMARICVSLIVALFLNVAALTFVPSKHDLIYARDMVYENRLIKIEKSIAEINKRIDELLKK